MLAGRVLAANKLAVPVGTIEHDWRGIWMTPAWLAVGVLVIFLIFFRDPRRATALVPAGEDAAGLEEGPP
jgi:hypothetical protein